MINYKDIYVFTDEHHPKRAHRYGHHFHIKGYWKDGIANVVWHTDGKTGHVREGEYKSVEEWRQQEGKAETSVRREKEIKRKEDEAMWTETAEILRDVKLEISCAMYKYRAERAKADSFVLA